MVSAAIVFVLLGAALPCEQGVAGIARAVRGPVVRTGTASAQLLAGGTFLCAGLIPASEPM